MPIVVRQPEAGFLVTVDEPCEDLVYRGHLQMTQDMLDTRWETMKALSVARMHTDGPITTYAVCSEGGCREITISYGVPDGPQPFFCKHMLAALSQHLCATQGVDWVLGYTVSKARLTVLADPLRINEWLWAIVKRRKV